MSYAIPKPYLVGDGAPSLVGVAMNEIDLAERMAVAMPWDFPDDYRRYGDRPNACQCGRVFKGNPARTECRVCLEGHNTIGDLPCS